MGPFFRRGLPLLLVSVVWIGLFSTAAWGSWFIDPVRRHVSIHAEMTCLDCHGDAAEAEQHPSPTDAVKSRRDFFAQDDCLQCHDGALEDLAQGVHGDRRGVDPERYQQCFTCHNAHYLRLRDPEAKGRFVAGKPLAEQCGVCHEAKAELPEPDEDEAACLECHRIPPPAGVERRERIAGFCYQCHEPGRMDSDLTYPLIDPALMDKGAHKANDCLECHTGAAAFDHGRQRPVDCESCHTRHGEGETGDAHIGVDCQACHMSGMTPVYDKAWGRVRGATAKPGLASAVHQLAEAKNDETCRRCHTAGNRVGAAAMVLPAKSILCMPCHTATLSAGDPITIAALLIFLFGMATAVSVWFSGGASFGAALSEAARALFSRRIVRISKAVVLDGLLQRRLFERSPGRWFIHSLIFWPFVLRFTWGIVALIWSSWYPECDYGWVLLDKNQPGTALFFDFTGLSVIVGVVLAVIRRQWADRFGGRAEGLPRQDLLAMGLIGGLVLVGFVLEGMRIAMTSPPAWEASWAFIGYALSRLFMGRQGLTEAYGYVWYLHAGLTGAFAAYLPFSRMIHIVMGPLAAAVKNDEC